MTDLPSVALGPAVAAALGLLGLLLVLLGAVNGAGAASVPQSAIPGTLWVPQLATTPLVLQEGPLEDDNGVYGVAWAPNGARLASAHYGGRIKIWNTTDGKLGRTIDATGPLYTIAWSHNGKWLAAGYAGDTPRVVIWDAATGAQVRELRGEHRVRERRGLGARRYTAGLGIGR